MTELSDVLAAALPEDYSEPERERWVCDNDRKAAWAIRVLRGIRENIAANNSMAADEISRIEQWRDDVNKPLVDDSAYFVAVLTQYALQQRADADRKSIKLPHGVLKTREGSVEWAIDPEAFIAWATVSAPDLLKVEVSAKLGEAKKALRIVGVDPVVGDDGEIVSPATTQIISLTGEIVPGITTAQKDPSVTIETN